MFGPLVSSRFFTAIFCSNHPDIIMSCAPQILLWWHFVPIPHVLPSHVFYFHDHLSQLDVFHLCPAISPPPDNTASTFSSSCAGSPCSISLQNSKPCLPVEVCLFFFVCVFLFLACFLLRLDHRLDDSQVRLPPWFGSKCGGQNSHPSRYERNRGSLRL